MSKNKIIKTAGAVTAAVSAGAGLLFAEKNLIFHFGLEKAGDALNRYWKKHNNTPEFARELIREGCKWLDTQDVKDVTVASFDGLTLRGHFLSNPKAERLLICFHGYRSTAYYDFGALARFLYESGCSLLLAEQRGHRISDGRYVSMGILERRDVVTWAEYANEIVAAQKEGFAPGDLLPIYLFGISMGAATVLMSLDQKLPSNTAGVIADCGYSNTYEEARYFGSHFGIPFSKLKMPWINRICMKKGGYSLKDANPIDALQKAQIPVLFFHGTADELVPVQNGYDNYEACASPKKLVIVEGAEHAHSCFMARERYEREVLDFFERTEVSGQTEE